MRSVSTTTGGPSRMTNATHWESHCLSLLRPPIWLAGYDSTNDDSIDGTEDANPVINLEIHSFQATNNSLYPNNRRKP